MNEYNFPKVKKCNCSVWNADECVCGAWNDEQRTTREIKDAVLKICNGCKADVCTDCPVYKLRSLLYGEQNNEKKN